MEEKDEVSARISVQELLVLLKKYILLMIAAAVLCGGLATAYSLALVPTRYVAKAKMYVVSTSGTTINLQELQIGSNLTEDFINLMTDEAFLEPVAENLKLEEQGYTWRYLKSLVEVANPKDTHLLDVKVTALEPTLAKSVANELADVASAKLAEIMQTSQLRVVRYAETAEAVAGTSVIRNAVLFAMVGALIVYGIGFLLFILDDTVKTPSDVEKLIGADTIGEISDMRELAKAKRSGYGYGYGHRHRYGSNRPEAVSVEGDNRK